MANKKEIEVFDDLKQKVIIGDIIAFVEQKSTSNGYGKASMANAIVIGITEKTLKLKPIVVTHEEYMQRFKHDTTAVEDLRGHVMTTARKLLDYHYSTFFKVGHCSDGNLVLELI